MSEITGNAFLQKNINFKNLATEFIRRRYLVGIIVVVCFVAAFIYSVFIATPIYTSNAKLYVVNKQAQNLTSSDMSVSSYLTYDFAEIIKNDVILDKVSKSLDGKYSASQLRGLIDIDIPQSTRIISITVKSPNPEDSKKIADSICVTAQSTLVEIMDLDKIEILNQGKVSKRQTSPILSNDLLLGLGCGLAISIVTVFLIYSLDNKISSSKDVEQYLGLTVLATIPYNTSKKSK